MKYDISKNVSPAMPSLQKSQKASKFCLFSPQKTFEMPFFDAFFFTRRKISASKNHGVCCVLEVSCYESEVKCRRSE